MTAPIQSDRSPRWGASKPQDVAHRRSITVGIGISAVVHVVFVMLYSVVMTQWIPREAVVGMDNPSRPSNEMRIVRVVEIEIPDLTVEEPEELPEPEEIRVEFAPVGLAPVENPIELDEPPSPRRASEALRVLSSDNRLWREALPEAFELTEVQRMELELAGRIEEWTDSVAAVLAAEYALTDWTTTDGQGRRWGVSPGQIHLGGLTLPLPFYFGGNAWQRDQWALRAWEEMDIINGANTQAVQASWSERSKAIRARRDRNRTGNAAAADTTGGSGG